MIYVTYLGVVLLPAGSYDRLLRGELKGKARLFENPNFRLTAAQRGLDEEMA